jgi:Ca2+-binding RTX toxin-like protein
MVHKIKGNSSNNNLLGTDANDEIRGLRGNDRLAGGKGNDRLFGGQGDDILNGAVGDDSLFGNDGNDSLWGGFGSDTLNGGSGDDDLTGCAPSVSFVPMPLPGGVNYRLPLMLRNPNQGFNTIDTLTGGEGADTFNLCDNLGFNCFYLGSQSNDYALITDFNAAEGDRLRFSTNQLLLSATRSPITVGDEYQIGAATFNVGGAAADTFIYQTATHDLVAVLQDTTIASLLTQGIVGA